MIYGLSLWISLAENSELDLGIDLYLKEVSTYARMKVHLKSLQMWRFSRFSYVMTDLLISLTEIIDLYWDLSIL